MFSYTQLKKIFYKNYLFFAVEDTLNSVLTESGDEEEEDAVVNQVLDEIGIEISGKVSYYYFLIPISIILFGSGSLIILLQNMMSEAIEEFLFIHIILILDDTANTDTQYHIELA